MPQPHPCLDRPASPAAPWASACFCALLIASISLVQGCRRDAPAPPPAPPQAQPQAPPPPPQPVRLTPAEVSARLRPLFLALCDHGFNATALSSPVRTGTSAPPAAAPAPLPTLAALVEKECGLAGIDVAAVVKCATDVRQKLTPRQARDAVLAIYVTQALTDADAGNLHRAHVLLADATNEITAQHFDALSNTCAALRRFFREVPDGTRLQAVHQELDSFMQLSEEQLLLRGEHAAVLRAGGLADAADFSRRRLLARLRLLTLPVVDLAIARGESYGWRVPADVQEARDRLDEHGAALANREAANDGFLTEAKWANADQEQATLQAAAKRFSAIAAAGSPMSYDAEQQRFVPVGGKALTASDRITAVAEWIAGKPAIEQVRDGSGHLLLALHWLVEDRPTLAWAALVAGAERLLEEARSGETANGSTEGETDAGVVVTALTKRVNAYRLLTAASLVTPDLPGSVVEPANAVLAEAEVLLIAWRQAWIKAGLSQKAADRLVADFARNLEQQRLQNNVGLEASRWPQGDDRYFFFDYRFLGNGVPEVLVTKASAEELVENARLPELATTERFLEFVKSFPLPRTFSPRVTR